MHTFEVTIKKHRKVGQTEFTWPEWWNEVVQDVDVVAYEDNPNKRGHITEGAICVCDDETWAKIEAKHDPMITERTVEEANERGRKWRPQVERIVDDKAVLSVLAKAVRGEALSDEDKHVLDPDHPAKGVNKSPAFDVAKIMEEKEHGKAKSLHRNA